MDGGDAASRSADAGTRSQEGPSGHRPSAPAPRPTFPGAPLAMGRRLSLPLPRNEHGRTPGDVLSHLTPVSLVPSRVLARRLF